MERTKYVAPAFQLDAFNCPLCNAYAKQDWESVNGLTEFDNDIPVLDPNLSFAICARCDQPSCWVGDKIVYPPEVTAPLAHEDMPESVLELYNEAREISSASPRAAAALLRLVAKKICEYHGVKDANLNKAIGKLKEKDLPEKVIKSLDVVRIVGNEGGAHEGQIDLSGEDSKAVVDKLFWLINFIVEKTISEPAEVEEFFQSMPESKKEAVKKRDEPEEGS